MRANGAGVLLNNPCANLDPVSIYEHPPLPESHIPNRLLQAGANPYLSQMKLVSKHINR